MVELGIEPIIVLIIIVSTGFSFVSVPVNERGWWSARG